MSLASRLFGALDWINHHLFRDRIIWPCRLLDWALDKQATPYVRSGEDVTFPADSAPAAGLNDWEW